MTSPRLISLTGYRGTGKSSVGPLLAAELGWRFIDADTELEARHHCTIRDIFATEGEAGFREKESAILAELTSETDLVLATGGGCVLRSENRDRLRVGFVVWLTAAPTTIWQRMSADPTTSERRPNLTTGGLAEIEELLAVREPLYSEVANLTLATDEESPSALAAAILRAWTSFSTIFDSPD